MSEGKRTHKSASRNNPRRNKPRKNLTDEKSVLMKSVQGALGYDDDRARQFCKECSWNEQKVTVQINEVLEYGRPNHSNEGLAWQTSKSSKRRGGGHGDSTETEGRKDRDSTRGERGRGGRGRSEGRGRGSGGHGAPYSARPRRERGSGSANQSHKTQSTPKATPTETRAAQPTAPAGSAWGRKTAPSFADILKAPTREKQEEEARKQREEQERQAARAQAEQERQAALALQAAAQAEQERLAAEAARQQAELEAARQAEIAAAEAAEAEMRKIEAQREAEQRAQAEREQAEEEQRLLAEQREKEEQEAAAQKEEEERQRLAKQTRRFGRETWVPAPGDQPKTTGTSTESLLGIGPFQNDGYHPALTSSQFNFSEAVTLPTLFADGNSEPAIKFGKPKTRPQPVQPAPVAPAPEPVAQPEPVPEVAPQTEESTPPEETAPLLEMKKKPQTEQPEQPAQPVPGHQQMYQQQHGQYYDPNYQYNAYMQNNFRGYPQQPQHWDEQYAYSQNAEFQQQFQPSYQQHRHQTAPKPNQQRRNQGQNFRRKNQGKTDVSGDAQGKPHNNNRNNTNQNYKQGGYNNKRDAQHGAFHNQHQQNFYPPNPNNFKSQSPPPPQSYPQKPFNKGQNVQYPPNQGFQQMHMNYSYPQPFGYHPQAYHHRMGGSMPVPMPHYYGMPQNYNQQDEFAQQYSVEQGGQPYPMANKGEAPTAEDTEATQTENKTGPKPSGPSQSDRMNSPYYNQPPQPQPILSGYGQQNFLQPQAYDGYGGEEYSNFHTQQSNQNWNT